MTPSVMPPHPLFQGRLFNLKMPWLRDLANRYLSFGGACYYLNEEGIRTRFHIYNYFALFNGGPFRCRWTLRAYAEDGKRFVERQGEIDAQKTETIEIEPLTRSLSPRGICMVYLDPIQGSQT